MLAALATTHEAPLRLTWVGGVIAHHLQDNIRKNSLLSRLGMSRNPAYLEKKSHTESSLLQLKRKFLLSPFRCWFKAPKAFQVGKDSCGEHLTGMGKEHQTVPSLIKFLNNPCGGGGTDWSEAGTRNKYQQMEPNN